MNTTESGHIARIAWKEFRQQIVFFVALIAIAVLIQVIVVSALNSTSGLTGESARWAFVTIGLFAALYGAACGGTLYATEKEEGTFATLQFLPLSARALLSGKLLVGGGLCLIFLVVAVLISMITGLMLDIGFFESAPATHASWAWLFVATFGLGVVEFFAWSWLFSLLLKRPLVASVLGIIFASASIQVATVWSFNGVLIDPLAFQPYVDAFWPRVFLALVVLAIDVMVATRWLHQPAKASGSSAVRSRFASSIGPAAWTRFWTEMYPQFGRFAWQAIRTSWPMMLVYAGAIVICIPIGFMGDSSFALFTIVCLFLLPGIAGVLMFSADKTEGTATFLNNHADKPGLYWAANCVVWLGWILMVQFILAATVWIVGYWLGWPIFTSQSFLLPLFLNSGGGYFEAAGMVFAFFLTLSYLAMGMSLSFAGGQLCSILIKSRVIAGIFAAVISAFLGIWFVLMLVSETPLVWSVLPLFASLMVMGWVTTRWWFSGRLSLGRIGILLSIFAALWVSLAAGAIAKRTFEIPTLPTTISGYRSTEGKPDNNVINQMRRNFSTAMDGFEFPKTLFSGIDQIQQKGIDLNNAGLDLAFWFTKSTGWEPFVQVYPDATPVQQLALLEQVLAENRNRIKDLHDAVAFAMDNIHQLNRMEPAFSGKTNDPSSADPPIPWRGSEASQLLMMDFFHAVHKQDSEAAWQSLKAVESYRKIRAIVYGEEWQFYYMHHYLSWLKLTNPDGELLREAFDYLQSEWTQPVDRFRIVEREYLQASQEVAQASWKDYRSRSRRVEEFKRLALNLFPWERKRSQRLLDLWTDWQMKVIRARQSQAELNRELQRLAELAIETGERIHVKGKKRRIAKTGKDRDPEFESWVDNTILPPSRLFELRTIGRAGGQRQHEWQDNRRKSRFTRQQELDALILHVRVLVWYHEHGQFPKDQNQLSEEFEDPPSMNSDYWQNYRDAKSSLILSPFAGGSGDRFITLWTVDGLQDAPLSHHLTHIERPDLNQEQP